MGNETSTRAQTNAPVWIVIILLIAVSGCLLEDKIIIDEYDAVFGLSQDATQQITSIANSLSGSYCLGAGVVQLSAKVTQGSPGPNQLDVKATIRDSGAQDLGNQTYTLLGKATKTGSSFKRQNFPVNILPPDNCVPAGGSIDVEVTPRNGSISLNAKLNSRVRVWDIN